MIHQNMNAILQLHEERVQAYLSETRETDHRDQIEGQRPSWFSAQIHLILCRIGSRLVTWGRRLECYSYRELSPTR